MSLLDTQLKLDEKGNIVTTDWAGAATAAMLAAYQPTGLERDRLSMVRNDFSSGYTLLQRPRREFNDLSLINRIAVDQMAWSVYQPNDGDAVNGLDQNAWRSNAVRPIVRDKVFSIAAHITAHTLFPKIVAFDKDSTEQKEAAQVMSDLIEWSTFNTNATFADVSLQAVISALVNPVSIVWTEYSEVYKTVKREKREDGTYTTEVILDEDLSGFIDESIPPDQLYIQDFYQPDVQKQGWIIRRRVRPYTLLSALYNEKCENFKYVRPGVQVLFNDANQQFYEAYDLTMRQDECEEVIYFNRALDLKLIVVNGIMMTDADNPNPREDKLYPCATFGYEYLRANGDCFYWKSLAFKTMPDDKIVNTLYPMIIDGTYLAIMPPMINLGGEIITSDVIAPGAVTTFTDPNSDLKPLGVQNENLKAGMDALFKVEQNITEDAFQPLQQGDMPDNGGNMPAYNMSQMEKNAKLMMGPFLDMVGRYVKQMGRLRIGDIKQYLTLTEVAAIEGSGNQDLVYKTFFLPQGKSRGKSKKIRFSGDMPDDDITEGDHLKHSYKLLSEEKRTKHSIAEVNPTLFRNLKYTCIVTADVLAPLSEEMEASYNLQTFDRMIQSPNLFDPEETGKLLMDTSPTTKKHPEKYLAKQPSFSDPMAQQQQPPQGQQPQQGQGLSTPAPQPTMAMAGK